MSPIRNSDRRAFRRAFDSSDARPMLPLQPNRFRCRARYGVDLAMPQRVVVACSQPRAAIMSTTAGREAVAAPPRAPPTEFALYRPAEPFLFFRCARFAAIPGGRYGRARRTKFRGRATKFPSSRPENFEAPRSGPEIPECSSLRIYSRIPRSLLVIRPVIAPARRRATASANECYLTR